MRFQSCARGTHFNRYIHLPALWSCRSTHFPCSRHRLRRLYSKHHAPSPDSSDDYTPKAALTWVETKLGHDTFNPPRSVLPPILQLPVRGPNDNVFIYLFNLGRAYGGFYKDGIKAVWYNNKAARLLQKRIISEGVQNVGEAGANKKLTRAEWQLLARNKHDIGKLPLFGLLVLVFGEWLPLLVPFMPAVVPGTCRIPKQITDMRKTAEDRRRVSFRRGTPEPSTQQVAEVIRDANSDTKQLDHIIKLLGKLEANQLLHLSTVLNLHNRLWNVLQLAPPSALLHRSISKRLQYLSIDDNLLQHQAARHASSRLSAAELAIACEERGIDVLGKQDEILRRELDIWLHNQHADLAKGSAVLTMLFRRPNAWPAAKP